MGQESKVAIVGGGASGCICAYHLANYGISVSVFEKNAPLRTILPTGGGRCNLAFAEYDFKELAPNYPRGEKFLYSVFSQFSTQDTIKMFNEMGIETYVQDDKRIFPKSNSAKEVRSVILSKLNKKGVRFITQKITDLTPLFDVYDYVIISVGGHSGYELLKTQNIDIIPPKPSLVGLSANENFSELSGIVCKNVKINNLDGDMLFTHFGISGPVVYKLSSYNAYKEYPYEINADLYPQKLFLQDKLNQFPNKNIKNVLSMYLPQKVSDYILKQLNISCKASEINKILRNNIEDKIHNFKITITGANKGEETVTAGGVNLKEVNSKTMEIKKYPKLYCIGEVLDIDGFCGGFNLQNAWSTAYVCANDIIRRTQNSINN